jgi:putative peptidoglycan lipid II flippase
MSGKLLKSTAIVGAMTLVSRVLGLVRDMVLARLFGADAAMDAFFVAFKIPNFLRRLFAEGAFSQAFVPVISEYREQQPAATVQALVNRVAGTLLGILSLLTVLGVLASPVLVMIFAPGFLHRNPEQFVLAAQLLSITFPYLLFVSLVAFAAGILNTYGRFAAASFVPVWLNVVLIGAAVLVSPRLDQPVFALAGGVFVAGVVQVLFLLPSLRRLGIVPRPQWGLRDAGVRRIMKLMLPGILGSSVAQINLLLDTLIASFLVSGSVSWLYYSDRLVEFPLGVFAIALSTVILPSLSRSHANGSREEFSRTLDWGLRVVLLIGVPATIGLLLLARPMLATLFHYGDFDATDVAMSGLSLMAYAFGLPGFMLIKVLTPAFYSRKDVRTPVRIAVIAMFTNMLLNISLVVPMVVMGIAGPHAGLALATSLAAWVNAGLLYRTLGRQQVFTAQAGWPRLFLQLALAGSALAALLLWGVPALESWLQWSAGQRAWRLAFWVLAGAAGYLLALRVAGMRLSSLWHYGQHGG